MEVGAWLRGWYRRLTLTSSIATSVLMQLKLQHETVSPFCRINTDIQSTPHFSKLFESAFITLVHSE